jgi:hypothetical protein
MLFLNSSPFFSLIEEPLDFKIIINLDHFKTVILMLLFLIILIILL